MSQTDALDCSIARQIEQPGVLHLKREASGSAHFSDAFAELFDAHFARLFRYLHRWSGNAELAADAAQETFVRLYERGSMPDRPAAWLITVALNQARNARTTRSRQSQLLTPARGEHIVADRQPLPAEETEANEARARVRTTLDRLCARDRSLLLLRAEGFAYRDIAEALELNEASVGTMLARARDAFRQLWEETLDALDVEQVERFVAGELTADAAVAARSHVAACPACAARVEAARSADASVSGLFQQLDREPPRMNPLSMMRSARASRFSWGARAASFLALLGFAAAAYAFPGSPVREWLAGERDAKAIPVAASSEVISGIAVEPGPSLVIAFARTQIAGEAHVVLSDSGVVAVSARSGAAAFSSEEGRLLVDNHDRAATFEILIPRGAVRVEIRVADRRLFLKEGTRIAAHPVAPDGSYHLALQ